jgi:tetratricopeptide (TPR) repeat protein
LHHLEATKMSIAQSSEQLLEHAKQLRAEKRLQESAAAYQQLIDSGLHRGEAFYGLGLVHLDSGDHQSAARALETALSHDPGNANAYYYLGEIWTARSAPEIAQSFYAKALAVNPQHAGALKRRDPAMRPAVAADQQPLKQDGVEGFDAGFYGLLQRDPSPIARQSVQLIDNLSTSVSPSLTAYLGRLFGLFLVSTVPALAVVLLRAPARLPAGPANVALAILLVAAVVIPLLYVVQIKTTRYTFDKGRLQIARGILMRRVSNIELYRVVDLEMQQTFVNRITGDGTIVLLVDGGRSIGQQGRIPLTGIARGQRLQALFEELRSLVLLLRTGNWGKGFIT